MRLISIFLFLISTYCFAEGEVFCASSTEPSLEQSLELAQKKLNQKLTSLRVKENLVSAPSQYVSAETHFVSLCVTIFPR